MDVMILDKWFYENCVISNQGKCPSMLLGKKDLSYKIKLNKKEITSSNEENSCVFFLTASLTLKVIRFLFVKSKAK